MNYIVAGICRSYIPSERSTKKWQIVVLNNLGLSCNQFFYPLKHVLKLTVELRGHSWVCLRQCWNDLKFNLFFIFFSNKWRWNQKVLTRSVWSNTYLRWESGIVSHTHSLPFLLSCGSLSRIREFFRKAIKGCVRYSLP